MSDDTVQRTQNATQIFRQIHDLRRPLLGLSFVSAISNHGSGR